MYEEFYGLSDKPFSLTPNPRYVCYLEHYYTALEQLVYALGEREGFLLLTGVVGAGKTTLCRELLEYLNGKKYRTALLFNPFLNSIEMLQALLTEFGCDYPAGASRKELLDRLNHYLLEQLVQGYTCVAIFDEAQHLSPEFLEQIRVLSNLETSDEKLMQILLVGQPELRDRIQQPGLAQLDQRVSLRCALRPLDRDETERYIYHRLNVAGARGRIRLARQAIGRIHEESGGVPRLINLICDRALLAGYVARTTNLGGREVRQAIRALQGDDAGPQLLPRPSSWRRRWVRPLAATVSCALAASVMAVTAFWYTGGFP